MSAGGQTPARTAWREERERDVPVTKGSFFREAVLYSWNGMSLVKSLRTLS
jgi:hypothetical protein